jgi:Flp pilus assembly protein TadG
MHPLFDLLARFRKDERGVFGVIFAVLAIVLVAFSGAVVDFTAMQTARSRAQTALDAAALALQATMDNTGVTAATLKVSAQSLLVERLGDASITATVDSATPNKDTNTLNLQATIQVPTAFVQLVGIRSISSHLQSEATQQSNNLEVAVALDTTGSMGGTKISDLSTALLNLIDQLVKDKQPPDVSTFTRMALVPYAAQVNPGTYLAKTRGPVNGTATITGVAWKSASSTVTSVTKNTVTTLTTNTTLGVVAGNYVYVSGATGLTAINGGPYKVSSVSGKTFTIPVNTKSSTKTYGSNSATVSKCISSTCDLVVTLSKDPYVTSGDEVYITGVKGTTSINGSSPSDSTTVAAVTKTGTSTWTYELPDEDAQSSAAYTSGGTSYCEKYSCQYLRYTAASGSTYVDTVSACATERPGPSQGTTDATDTAPGIGTATASPVGFNYAPVRTSGKGSSNAFPCIAQTVLPLTSNKDDLNYIANHLNASGSTAGQIGLAWAWYMVSPNFASIFADNTPAQKADWTYGGSPYDTKKLVKAVVLMTDGAFNTAYYQGETAKDSGIPSGSTKGGAGGTDDWINHNAANGQSRDQAKALCTAIKNSGPTDNKTLLYTVGFDLGSDSDSLTFLSDCATPGNFHQADTGDDLKAAFKSIADNLSDLRLSK